MHSQLVPLFLRQTYEEANYKERIDALASDLLASGYASSTIRTHIREWLCFLDSRAGIDETLPQLDAPAVVGYLKRRCSARKEGVRHVRASLRILLCDDAPGTQLKKARSSTPLFESVVPAYLDFLHRHRGVHSTRTMEGYLRQFFLFLDDRGVAELVSVQAQHYRAFLSSCASRMAKGTVSGVASVLRGLAR